MATSSAPTVTAIPDASAGAIVRSRERITVPALALALGICIGGFQPRPVVWPWLLVSSSALGAAAALRALNRRGILGLVAVAAVGFGEEAAVGGVVR